MDAARLKQDACAAVDSLRDQLLEISHAIHANPELAFEEHAASALLSDAIEAGEMPGELALDAFFVDGIHLSALGNYYMALVHVSAIARRSPVGATNRVPHSEGEGWEIPADVAEALQELAWRCVRDYPRSGVLRP